MATRGLQAAGEAQNRADAAVAADAARRRRRRRPSPGDGAPWTASAAEAGRGLVGLMPAAALASTLKDVVVAVPPPGCLPRAGERPRRWEGGGRRAGPNDWGEAGFRPSDGLGRPRPASAAVSAHRPAAADERCPDCGRTCDGGPGRPKTVLVRGRVAPGTGEPLRVPRLVDMAADGRPGVERASLPDRVEHLCQAAARALGAAGAQVIQASLPAWSYAG